MPPAPAEGTVSNFATVILERLADPLRPHDPRPEIGNAANPQWNPYIPIDLQPVDLTIFTGEAPTVWKSARMAPPQPFRFYTRQRGFGSDLQAFDNAATLNGTGQIKRNPNPWRPLGAKPATP
ncbi:MAG: hypothetical protein ACKOCX_12365, partial [Planctomycetota bacterium]